MEPRWTILAVDDGRSLVGLVLSRRKERLLPGLGSEKGAKACCSRGIGR